MMWKPSVNAIWRARLHELRGQRKAQVHGLLAVAVATGSAVRSSLQSISAAPARSSNWGPRVAREVSPRPRSMNASTRLRAPVISRSVHAEPGGERDQRRAARGGALPTAAIAEPRPIIAMMPLSW